MNQDKSLRFMVFMMNAAANMAIQMSGNASLSSSTSCHSLLSSKINFSASMEDFLPALRHLTTFELSKDSRKYHMKDQCATCSGQTLMIGQDGE